MPAEGDHVAVIGDNRKLLVFPLDQVPEMARGAGVILQRYKDGGLADAKVFRLAEGLTWRLGERDAHRNRICATGWASARRPAACRRTGSRARRSSEGEIIDGRASGPA